MATVQLHAAELQDLTPGLLEASGVPADTAGRVGAFLVRAELSGHGSHGVAVVTMHRSGHLGRLADYVELVAAEGLIAILAVNDSGANQVVAPHGSDEARLATNPIAIGIPHATPPHLVLDMSTSVVSHGTLERLALEGETIPEGWTTGDVLLPLGGAKGTGLALVVDVLAGILSGAGFSGVSAPDDDQGVWIVALEPTRFLPAGHLERDVERLVSHVHSSRASMPGIGVLEPSELGALAAEAARRDGVCIPAALWADLVARARYQSVPIPIPLAEEVA